MKQLNTLFLSLLISSIHSLGQEPSHVDLTFNKTVHLIFPSEVSYFDVGSGDVLAEKRNATLKLVAKNENFAETNLTVVTMDNVWYTFLLDYQKDITQLTYFIRISQGKKVEGSLVKNQKAESSSLEDHPRMNQTPSDTDYVPHCLEVIRKAPSYWDVGAVNKKVFLALNNIFIHNDKLYFVISVGNSSNINYDVDFLKMSVVNKKKLKKSSIQEDIKEPLFIYNNIEKLEARTKTHFMVFVFDKFTIPDDRKLVFELYEKKGGRNISFDIKKDLISNALPIYK